MNGLIRTPLTIAGSLVLGLSIMLAARPADASVPGVWAFAYNDNPTPPPGYILPPAYQSGSFHTTCPGSMATISWFSTGKYLVKFPCSASSNGIVHVTAVDGAARYCEVEQWFDAGSDKFVIVLCFKSAFPDNARFTVTYTTSSGTTSVGAHAYVFSDPGGFAISNYNSAGLANTVTPIGTGRWKVMFPMLTTGSFEGDLQATAVNPQDAPRRCQIDNWYIDGVNYGVLISCTDANGILIDSWFTVSYHFKRPVYGALPPSVAYMTNLPGAPPGTDYNSAGWLNSFTTTTPGRYTMSFPGVGIGTASHMQVTAFGGPFGFYCQLEDVWTISATGNVRAPVICFNNGGLPVSNLLFSTFSAEP